MAIVCSSSYGYGDVTPVINEAGVEVCPDGSIQDMSLVATDQSDNGYDATKPPGPHNSDVPVEEIDYTPNGEFTQAGSHNTSPASLTGPGAPLDADAVLPGAGTTPSDIAEGDTSSDGGYSDDDYYTRSSGRYNGGGYGSGGGYTAPSDPFPFQDGFGNPAGDPVPTYADGWVHPLFGGTMSRSEWLAANAPPDDGSGPVPLPYVNNRTPSLPPDPNKQDYRPGENSLAAQMREKLTGNLFGKMTGSGYDSGAYATDAMYRRADKRYERDQKKLEEEYRRRQIFYSNLSNPGSMLPEARPGLSAASANWQQMNALPMGQLGLVLFGNKNDRFAQNPKTFQKSLSQLYTDFSTKPGVFDYNRLMQNLFNAGKNSSLTRSFQVQEAGEAKTNKLGLYKGTKEGKWDYAPAGTQVSNMLSTLGSIYSVTRPQMQDANMALAQQWANEWSYKYQNKKNPPSIMKFFGKKLGY